MDWAKPRRFRKLYLIGGYPFIKVFIVAQPLSFALAGQKQ